MSRGLIAYAMTDRVIRKGLIERGLIELGLINSPIRKGRIRGH